MLYIQHFRTEIESLEECISFFNDIFAFYNLYLFTFLWEDYFFFGFFCGPISKAPWTTKQNITHSSKGGKNSEQLRSVGRGTLP